MNAQRVLLSLGCLASAIAIAHTTVVLGDYQLRDPDSILYEWISESIAHKPLRDWIAPDWQPERWKSGLFQEHPATLFWPAAALTRLGVPRAALLTNFFYFAACLWALFALARHFAGMPAGWIAVALFCVSPLGIQYLLRFNHEVAWAACTTGALYCFLKRGRSFPRGASFIALVALACLVKGVLGLLVFPAAAALWLRQRDRAGVVLLVGAVVAVGVVAAIYEALYWHAAKQSFFAAYLGAQLGYVAQAEENRVLQKVLNVPYYLATLGYFALPGAVFFVLSLRSRFSAPRASRIRPPRIGGRDDLQDDRCPRRFRSRFTDPQWLVIGAGGVWVALLSFMSRHAVRYAFPVQGWILVAASTHLLSRSARAAEFVERNQRRMLVVITGLLVVIVVMRVLLDPLVYRDINLLPGTRVN